jgi:VWFA-related protein
MRRILWGIGVVFAVAVLPALGQAPASPKERYRIDFDPDRDLERVPGPGFQIKVRFSISRVSETNDDADMTYKVVVEEDGQRVAEEDVARPTPNEDLSAVLAMDISGSMSQAGRMDQARNAAKVFFQKLPGKADCGLILFDHEIRMELPLGPASRPELRREINNARPLGGTAYLDAIARAIDLLGLRGDTRREKAVVVMTDGVDLNSNCTVEEVIKLAEQRKVRVYTVGIGEPGRQEPITSVLVLDRSGSMEAPADDADKTPKITALRGAARRFIQTMSKSAKTTLLPFGSDVETPGNFTDNKVLLIQNLNLVRPSGETALFDAVFAGLETLEAGRPRGKRAVVALTDGIDNSSRRRVEEVLARAKELKVPLYMLGFGRPGELDEAVMKRMARESGGEYYHAKNEKSLLEIFENLSTLLHDDGVNEEELRRLSLATRGEYYPAKDVTKLQFVLEKVTQSIQKKDYSITFTSNRPKADGTFRHIVLKLVRRTGEAAANVAGGQIQAAGAGGGEEVVVQKGGGVKVHGLVVAEMSPLVYLTLAVVLGALLGLPEGLRRMRGKAAQP